MSFKVFNPIRELRKKLEEKEVEASRVFRSADASGSNMKNPEYGKANIPFSRKAGYAYANGIDSPAIRSSLTPREISNMIVQGISQHNNHNLSNYVWLWGQIVDHTITLTPEGDEELNMITPSDDNYPDLTIPFKRSKPFVHKSPREQINELSSYIDAASIYGADSYRAYALRKLDGTGKLKTSVADNGEILLPYNVDNLRNAMSDSSSFFLAGDIRANEQAYLTALHVLFVREHNRLCDRFSYLEDDEMIYQYSRRYVTGLLQHITFNEFLPALLGEKMPEYGGYDDNIKPDLVNEFSSALFRIGHTMVPETLKNWGKADVDLKDIFFNPVFVKTNGVDSLLRGACETLQESIDIHIVEALRSFLFHAPDATLLDLASLNINRGLDHGISDYNSLRNAYGLSTQTFEQITSDVVLQNKLRDIYVTANKIDPWVGALCEDHLPGKPLGELSYVSIKEQFLRIRDGDRFWFENDPMMKNFVSEIRNTLLSDIINRNCELQVKKDVFHVI